MDILTHNLSLQQSLIDIIILGDPKQSLEQQKIILLRLLLALYDVKQQVLSQKQFEQIFFQVIKVLSNKNQQIIVLSVQIISILAQHVPSAFFATRSLTTVYEKCSAIKAPSLRLLGKIANSASIGDVQRLLKLSLTSKNERLITSAVIVAKKQGINIDIDLGKLFGPVGYIVGQIKPIEKMIGVQNHYLQFALVQRADEIIDERKRLLVLLQIFPASAKDVHQEKYFVYVDGLKQINKMNMNAIKAQQQQISSYFIILFQQCRGDIQRIAVLRELALFYGQSSLQAEIVSVFSNLLRTTATTPNHLISSISLTALISRQPQIVDCSKLISILTYLSKNVQQKALLALEQLPNNESNAIVAINTAQLMVKSFDVNVRNSGFRMLLSLIKYDFESIIQILLEDIDQCTDNNINRQICEILGQTTSQQLKVTSILLQRCLLGNECLQQSAYQGLTQLFQQSNPQDVFYETLEKTLDNIQIETDFIESFTPESTIDNFSLQDILFYQNEILEGNFDIEFGTAVEQQQQKKQQNSSNQQNVENIIEKNYDEIFTRGVFEAAASSTLDVTVQLCKIFLIKGGQNILKLLYKVTPDEGIECKDQVITIGKFKSTINEWDHHEISIQYKDISEIANLTNCKLKYTDCEGETEVSKLFDVTISNYDLFQQIEIENYIQIFEQEQDKTEEIILHLEDIQDVSTAIENIPSFCGLLITEVVSETYKKAQFYMTGSLKNVGFVVCKVDIKLAKIGVKVKIHAVGPASQALYEMLE